jgi:hypothetical protein
MGLGSRDSTLKLMRMGNPLWLPCVEIKLHVISVTAHPAARLYFPGTSSIVHQRTMLDCPLALRAYDDPIMLAVINFALAYNGVAAMRDN